MDTSMQPYTVVEGAAFEAASFRTNGCCSAIIATLGPSAVVDPSSGTASMMEHDALALVNSGSAHPVPRRTVVVCSWMAKNMRSRVRRNGASNSADDLKKKLVRLSHVDESVAGKRLRRRVRRIELSPAAVASARAYVVEASKDVRVPSGKSLYEAWRATAMRDSKAGSRRSIARWSKTGLAAAPITTVFLNHLGRRSSIWVSRRLRRVSLDVR